jgi:ferritin-like metal-binding protein YciE
MKQQTNGKGKSADVANDSMLADFFHDELKDIYWAEQHLVKALPKMEKAAYTQELASAISQHLEQTKEHVSRLEKVFQMLGHKPASKKCEAMEGLVSEGETVIEDTEDGTATRDVGVIMAAQKVEHYEIATYGSLVTLAKTLGYDKVAEVLAKTLEEEKQTDERLTEIAENDVNYIATAEEK